MLRLNHSFQENLLVQIVSQVQGHLLYLFLQPSVLAVKTLQDQGHLIFPLQGSKSQKTVYPTLDKRLKQHKR